MMVMSLASHADRRRVACGFFAQLPGDHGNHDNQLIVSAEFHYPPGGYSTPLSLDPREIEAQGRANMLPYIIDALAARRIDDFADMHPRRGGYVSPAEADAHFDKHRDRLLSSATLPTLIESGPPTPEMHDEPGTEMTPGALAAVRERRADTIQEHLHHAAVGFASEVDARLVAAYNEANANDRSMHTSAGHARPPHIR